MTTVQKQKILAVLGPTAGGKSSVAIHLALHFSGEIISADSRQVYRWLDIGSNKITKSEMEGVPHHLLNIADPRERFSVADFRREARSAVDEIAKRGKLPIVVGGTAFYIDALLGEVCVPEVPPDNALRAKLEMKSTQELYNELKEKDPERAKTIDQHNKRRLVRALEIVSALGYVPKEKKGESLYDVLKIALAVPQKDLEEKIEKRLEKDFARGLVEEVETLHKKGLSWERMEELGLQYRSVSRFLRGTLGEKEMKDELAHEIRRYAKRQMTYLKRDKETYWFPYEDLGSMENTIQKFLSL
ncbi:MAG: tRNA (adenosine(37)-N6)-dimethylallyltransferase MiaA [Candidatus Paceibacterota bacterium]